MTTRSRSPWFALGAMAAANVLVTLDFFGLNTALPTIGREFDASTATLQSIANVYLLFLAAPLIAAGRLGDRYGRKRVCLGGLALFTAGSALAMVAPNAATLVGARGITGLGAAFVTATTLAIVNEAFPRARRGFAIGVWSAVGAIGAAVGPLVGGVVTQALSWRWFFGLSIPIAIAVALLTGIWAHESRDATRRRIDWTGTVLLTVALASLVGALLRGPVDGWSNPRTLGGIATGAALLVAFAVVERRATSPLLEFRLFARHSFTVPSAVAFVGNFAFGVVMFYMTLYLQQVRGLSPTETGLTFLALTIPLAVLAPPIGRATRRTRPDALMAIGLLFLVGAFIGFSGITLDSTLLRTVLALVVCGIGQAAVFNVSNIAALAAVPDDDAGVASGAVNGLRQLGTLVGLALVGAVFNGVQQLRLDDGAPKDTAFIDALGPAMFVVAALCAATAVMTLVALRRDRVDGTAPPAAATGSPVAHPPASGAR